VPIGAHATVDGGRLRLLGVVASPDGSELLRAEAEGDAADAGAIGSKLGEELLGRGGRAILDAVYSA
jgi:hydroxymethylbilane synthase